MQNKKLASVFLRIGLAAMLLYASVAATLDPFSWIGFFPPWLRDVIPDRILLGGHSFFEALLALWLLSGWKTSLAALFSALSLAAIVVFNIGVLDITFRDVGLLFAALALYALERREP